MLILVINNGSTSFRFNLVDITKNFSLAYGGVENIGTPLSYYKYTNYKNDIKKIDKSMMDHNDAMSLMCDYLIDTDYGVINNFDSIEAIGHRVVHGGEKYTSATIINNNVLEDIKDLCKLAPLHNSKAIQSIVECKNNFSSISNIAVFDTAFHSTIPKVNFMYPIPQDLYEKHKIRKYGFHGISYSYVLDEYSNLIFKKKDDINTVICHLGGGASMCAVKNGKSFDTTMEYTPLTGLIMVTRSGSIDPSILPSIMKAYNITLEETLDLLNKRSGYFAIANSKDAKSVVERSLAGDKDSQFLREMLNKNFKKHLLSMMANLGRVDSIILTGGIGTKNKEQRELFMSDLEFFGIKLDNDKNNSLFNSVGVISSDTSNIPIYVIPSNEEFEIARQCQKVLEKKI